MPRKPHTTIICITADHLVRADFDRPTAQPSITMRPRPAIDDLSGLVETTIRLRADIGKHVWVLSSDIFLQVAEITAVHGTLSDDEVRRALAFELEPLSNISALESIVAYAPLTGHPDSPLYLAAQINRDEAERIDEVVRRAGAELEGIVHPAGVPAPFHQAAPLDSWCRIEQWSDAAIRISRTPGQPVVRSPIQAGLSGVTGSHSAHSATSEAYPENTEYLLTSASDQPTMDAPHVRRLQSESDFSDLLQAWSRVLTEGHAPTQIVEPPKRPVPAKTWTVLAVACALLAIAACVAHWWYTNQQLDTLTAEIEERRAPAEVRDRLERDIISAQARIAMSMQRLAALESNATEAQAAIVAYQSRAPEVLRSIWNASAALSGSMTLMRIDSDENGLLLIGDALSPSIPDEFAQSLVEPLQTVGLRVDPPRTQVADRMWTFSLPLQDAVTVTTSTRVEAPKPVGRRGRPR